MNSIKKKPFKKKTFAEYSAPAEYVDNNFLGQMLSLVMQGDFGTIYDNIKGQSTNLNAQYDGKLLINSIIQVNEEQVSEEKKLDLITYLVLHNQLYINAYDDTGLTPIHVAIQKGHEKILDYLITKNANINAKTMNNMTPLHFATLMNLRACPKNNAPEELVVREGNPDIRSKDIDDILIPYLVGPGIGYPLKNDPYVPVSILKNAKMISLFFLEILKGYDLMLTETKKKSELIKKIISDNIASDKTADNLKKTIENDLKKLKYPDGMMNKVINLIDLANINEETIGDKEYYKHFDFVYKKYKGRNIDKIIEWVKNGFIVY